MKFLMSLIALLMFNKACDSKATTNTVESTPMVETMSTNTQQDMTITYEATSRGFFEKIWVTKDALFVSNDRNLVDKETYACSKDDWNTLMSLLNNVNTKELPSLEAPTSNRLFDGAAHASLSITKDDSTIQSNSFDHGHPPQAIEKLVNKVLSMTKNAQKQ